MYLADPFRVKQTSIKFLLWCTGLLLGLTLRAGTEQGPVREAPADQIDLTSEERAWIAEHPVIRVGEDTTYEPYAILDQAGRIVGIDADYLDLISRRTGLKFHFQARSNWTIMLEAFKAGEVDLLPSLGYDPDRELFLNYTRSYAFAPNVIVTQKDSQNLFSIADLKGRKVGIPKGYSGLRHDLAENAPGNEIVEYNTPLECYQAVARGEVFATIADLANASYLIKTHGLTTLRLGSVISTSSDIFIGVRKDWPMLVQILNKALFSITPEDRLRVNNRWGSVEFTTDGRWAAAFRIAAGIAVAAVLVFLFVFYHNRRLARELTVRRRIQGELEQTRDQLVRASQEKSELLHMVAHDLRSPLTGIQLGVELLQGDFTSSAAELAAAAGRIKSSAGQMARLINDLLSAQNMEEGHFSLHFVAGDAVELARAAVAALRPASEHKRITVDLIVPAGPVVLTTDFVALQQVVDNLLSNALKYSPPGSRVEIVLATTPTHCRFEIRDQGPGVKPQEREKIFEKFGRGSAQPTQGEGSLGLGLWIVRRFAVALHGRVWCESGPRENGSVFFVEVPRTPPVAVA